jgi:hypothetical protein
VGVMTESNEKADFRELIPELKNWKRDGKGIDVETWIGCEGDHKHLIGYARILWPNFVEHDGCIFLGESLDDASYRSWLAQTQGDKKKVEAVLNHRHILDLFSRSHHEPPTQEIVLYVGRLMKDILQAKLSRDFPNRKVTVIFAEDGVGELVDYQITFFQER